MEFLQPQIVSKLGNLELIARLVVEGFITGLHKSPYHGFSVEFAEHRPYMPGDEIRHIDWKIYAKTDRFFIKQFEEETNLKAYLLLDASASMGYTSHAITKLRYAAILAASLTFLMLRQRDAVGLVTFDQLIRTLLPPRSVPSYLSLILKELQNTAAGSSTRIAAALHQTAERLHRRGLIILLSDLLDEPREILAGLKHFRHKKHEVIVFHLLDPREITFDFRQDGFFQDMESGETLPTQPWHVRSEYRRLAAQFIEEMKRECLSHRIDYVTVRTDTPLDRVLLEYLIKRKRIGG
ncbi:MAG: DUF58 domain-containing protein [candidate division KSB1 bacterium]|nr:DUF58 domain-containing protein [candidate division KSB1 bacterium]